eukprot:TRINITY_DN4391_c0_g1_i3.p1 TRINITY_DN4391_c0_g1~~TRINITY_DN4391_c0_g1_i3.p1  ORF type:complete len:255 (-),score=13.86 TRINITY_DN4391_c0_g1_i3:152-916(-)
MECRECHSTCLECEGGDSDECKSCDAVLNRFLLNGRCLCREGFYETSETNGVCARCHSSCDTCFGPKENQCILCPNNRRGPVDGSCICNPGLFIGPDGDCKRCHGSCKTCKGPSANDCLSCSNEKELNGTSCICKSGYFNNGGECIECHPNCKSCSGPGPNACLSCRLGRTLVDKSCPCSGKYVDDGNHRCLQISEWNSEEIKGFVVAIGISTLAVIAFMVYSLQKRKRIRTSDNEALLVRADYRNTHRRSLLS